MAKNFGSALGPHGKDKLMAEDLEVGQTLYDIGFSRWGKGATSLRKVYVKKILKTKIVMTYNSDLTLTSFPREARVRDGEVLTSRPGSGMYSNSIHLCTAEDPEVAEAQRDIDLLQAKNKARDAAEAIRWNEYTMPSIHIENLILASQEYLEALREQEAMENPND